MEGGGVVDGVSWARARLSPQDGPGSAEAKEKKKRKKKKKRKGKKTKNQSDRWIDGVMAGVQGQTDVDETGWLG